MNSKLIRVRALCGVLMALLAVGTLAACTDSTVPAATRSVSPDPNDVPPDDTDYSQDAGNESPDYRYEAEDALPASVSGILCNFTQEFFEGLRTVSAGAAVADDTLRTSLVGLSDLLAEGDALRDQYPEASKSVETARQISDAWQEALVHADNGDAPAAALSMALGERLIGTLPERTAVGCGG